MSGGSYDYAYEKVEAMADSLRTSGSCSAASPQLRERFREHLRVVAAAMRAIEWNDSCDGDDREEALIRKALGQPLFVVEQASIGFDANGAPVEGV